MCLANSSEVKYVFSNRANRPPFCHPHHDHRFFATRARQSANAGAPRPEQRCLRVMHFSHAGCSRVARAGHRVVCGLLAVHYRMCGSAGEDHPLAVSLVLWKSGRQTISRPLFAYPPGRKTRRLSFCYTPALHRYRPNDVCVHPHESRKIAENARDSSLPSSCLSGIVRPRINLAYNGL